VSGKAVAILLLLFLGYSLYGYFTDGGPVRRLAMNHACMCYQDNSSTFWKCHRDFSCHVEDLTEWQHPDIWNNPNLPAKMWSPIPWILTWQ